MVAPGLISGLATILDVGEAIEQEQAVVCLLILCNGSEKCSQMVLQEGVIPALVSISVNGTVRGKEKAQKLLMLFREQRQRDPSPVGSPHHTESSTEAVPGPESKPLESKALETKPLESKPYCKSISRRKVGKAWNYLWKSKNYSVYQC
ncbi:U-box domain-containing protein 45 [Vitis vinifera]|nr:U-box domain-containing protein 45 [Vitis vinifera]